VTSRYDDRGHGDAIVFSHGMMLDRTMFAPQVEALSPHYRTVAFDHRARWSDSEEPYSLYDLADDLRALLDELEIERCVLAGMSMGGFMAVRAALRHPDRIAGIVLIGASDLPYSPDDQARWEAYFGSHRGAATLPREVAEEQATGHFSERTRLQRPELVRAWTDRIATRSGNATYLEAVSWARQDDVRDAWAELDLPALVIHGDEDAAIPLEHALETFRRSRSGRLLVVPYAGHAVNLEDPDAVNNALATFLAETYARR
jgi:pimeloyl-ACP methyl ester carboxylesterase